MDLDERRELDAKLTTSRVLNAMAQDAGVVDRGDAKRVHGDDATYEATREAQRNEDNAPAAKLHRGIEVAKTVRVQALDVLDGWGALSDKLAFDKQVADAEGLFAPIALHKELITEVHKDYIRGQELHAALERDAMHLALVCGMKGVPASYVAHAKEERHTAATGEHAPYAKIVGELMKPENARLRVCLQIRTDEGMQMGLDFVRGGQKGSPKDFLKAQGLEARYRDDAAFHAGFDAMVFAAIHAPPEAEKAAAEMKKRDERYNLTQVFRG
jgi:hypothetical protein